MKILIEKDEWYPVYSVSESSDSESFYKQKEVDVKIYKKWIKAFKNFNECQKEIQALFNEVANE